MRFISPTILVSLALLAGIATASSEVHINSLRRKRHVNRQLVDRSLVEQNVTARALEKRFSDARFTFYAAGLGACGKTNSGSDFVSFGLIFLSLAMLIFFDIDCRFELSCMSLTLNILIYLTYVRKTAIQWWVALFRNNHHQRKWQNPFG
jgi:hypothetical protein